MENGRDQAFHRLHILTALVLLLVTATAIAPESRAQVDRDDSRSHMISSSFKYGRDYRIQGRFDQAVKIFSTLVDDYGDNEGVARRAYAELVFTLLEMNNRAEAEDVARAALLRFPDLQAPEASFPVRVQAFFDEQRPALFGSLTLTTNPDSCEVFSPDKSLGLTPLRIDFLPVGEYELKLRRAGYNGKTVDVQIGPSRDTVVDVPLYRGNVDVYRQMRFGFDVGVSYSFLTYTRDDSSVVGDSSPAPRVTIGVFLDLAVSDKWSLRPGLRLVRLGNEAIYDEGGLITSRQMYLDYLTIPVLAKRYFGVSRRFFISFGPEFAMLLDASRSGAPSPDGRLLVKGYNVVIDAGLGIEFPWRQRLPFLSILYSQGVIDQFDQGTPLNWVTGEIRVTAGILF